MAVHTSMLHIRIEDDIKAQASSALASMGMSIADAVRILLRRVVADQAFPLELRVPNAETVAAMQESRANLIARRKGFATAEALFDDLDKNAGK